MKKIITLLAVCFLAVANIKAQYVTIPDANFRAFLENKYPSCFNAAHEMDTTCSLIVSETSLDCSFQNIASLDGIQYFDGLLGLNCRGNLLTSIPRLPSVMNTVDCSNNPNLSCISRVPNAVSTFGLYLKITNTNIQCLPNYGNNVFLENGSLVLTPLCNATNNPSNCNIYPNNYAVIPPKFGNNLFSSKKIPNGLIKVDQQLSGTYLLDTTSTDLLSIDTLIVPGANIDDFKGLQYFKNLKYFDCSVNDFDSLPYLPSKLEYLKSTNLKLNTLPALPPNLKCLDCSWSIYLNTLPTLPVGLRYLNVEECAITSLPPLPDSLKYLNCSANGWISNRITSLPTLPPSLDSLILYSQKIASLPTLPNSLIYLQCSGDSLICLPYLPSNLKFLGINSTYITCLPNNVNGLTVQSDSTVMPICNSTNNPNNCPTFGAAPNYVNIPDTSFGKFLLAQYPTCLFKDASNLYWMDTTCSGVLTAKTIVTSGQFQYFPFASLQGIEYFKNLDSLDCFATLISNLSTLPKNLKYLNCGANQLTSLPTLPNSLLYLNCSDNNLGILPSLPNSLLYLDCSNTGISTLPILPPAIEIINCVQNINLKCLPYLPNSVFSLVLTNSGVTCLPNYPSGPKGFVSTIYQVCNPKNPNNCPVYNYVNIPDTSFGKFLLAQYPSCLYKDASNLYWMDTTCSGVVNATTMYCYNYTSINQIQNLEGIQYFKNILGFFGGGNLINNIPALPSSLRNLDCSYNQLTNLPPLPDKLEILNCSHNQLTSLPTLPSKFIILNCSHNQLTSLPTLPAHIRGLDCNSNLLTSLPSLPNGRMDSIICYGNNINCLPKLPDTLMLLGLDSSKIHCLPNLPKIIIEVLNFSTGYWASPISLSICNATNNPNNCPVYLANYVNIPDTSFGKFLLAQYPSCLYKDASNLYWMDTTCGGVMNETAIYCHNLGIKSIEGVQYFKTLHILYSNENQITYLPNLPNFLSRIELANNQLTSLPTLPNSLSYLELGNNQLTSLPTLPNSLIYLNLYNNQLTSLPTLPNNIQRLGCDINKLTSLPSIPNSVTVLSCENNLLTSLPSLPNSLQRLYCSNNKLTSFPNSTYPMLTTLYCSNNLLTSIPLLSATMDSLFCDGNVSLSCLPKLPAIIYSLDLSNTNIQCLPNMPSVNFMLPSTLSVCNSTNNPNNCPVYPANYVNIPDTSFGKFLLAQYPSCLYKDASNLYWMDTTCGGVVNETYLMCDNYTSFNKIQNLEGVQYFKSLTDLYCRYNNITSLPSLPKNLKYLFVESNALTTLPNLPASLKWLWCADNQLTSLPVFPDSLSLLLCSSNKLTNLPKLPSTLTGLNCSFNLLTSLPTLPSKMDSLYCDNNINLSCLPKLPQNANFLYFMLSVSNTNVHCLPNIPSSLTTTLPICNATNNPNNCPVYPPNYVNIPDTSFGKFLLAQYPSCLYKDASNLYWMDTTCSGVVNATDINCSSNKITDLSGVKYFKNLQTLNCKLNKISSLSDLPDSLRTLSCSFNKLQQLSPLPYKLLSLNCDSNMLTNLPTLPNKVTFITCNNNKLTGLPSLPDSLKTLYCKSNQLSVLPTLPDSLIYLNCDNNKLDSLPTLPNSLKFLYCNYNFLTHLPALNMALNVLVCQNNKLNSLPALSDSLTGLNCGNNFLTHLPLLSNSLITIITCNNNQLSTLPTLPNNLGFLDVSDNHIYCLPKLPSSLKTLFNFNTNINCIPNLITGLSIVPSSLPVCNPTNNANQCQAFPTVAGRVFTDNNSNGIKDANEFYRPFVKELASNGNATFSNLNGAFAFSFDSTGSYSLKTIAPKYFKAVPDSNGFSFGNNNIYLSVPDIALQPTAVKDSLAIVVTPLNSRARPGFSFPYHLGYANAGTTNLYTTVSFTYDTSRLIYDSSNVAIISNTNNAIVVSADSLIAGQGKYAQLYFTVKPTAVIGDTLFAFANATSAATTATSANATIIRGSFDPNDKVATPQLTPTQVANGDWIEYTIRFQNTGNDTAVNVVLADSLSILLQPGYFNVVATSHLANLTYSFKNNIVYFEFLNINLPDSATNYSGSQGWVTFKVKPLLGVTDGTYIDNKASIYFDYNKSVQTNLARTLISSTPMPVKLLNYELRLVNEATRNEKRVTNIWATTNEINASHFNIQRSIDGVNFKAIGQVAAKGGGSYNFTDALTINNLSSTIFYRLQMVDKDGRFEYSPIKQINLQASKSNIRLYPNPAKELVTIECANAKEVFITDYFGRVIYKSTVNNQLSIINLQGFARGIYLVQVLLENGSIVNEKLIVE